MDGFLPSAIWPADDPASAQIREVYARFGLAVYQAQVLEHGVVNAIIMLRMLPDIFNYADRVAWEEALDLAYNTEFEKTFGNLLRALDILSAPVAILDRLRGAKSVRDRLVHRFFREHDESFFSQAGRALMIAECEAAINSFESADSGLEEFMWPLCERYGLTKGRVQEQLEFMVAAAKSHGTG